MKSKQLEIAKKKWKGWWRFACGDVLGWKREFSNLFAFWMYAHRCSPWGRLFRSSLVSRCPIWWLRRGKRQLLLESSDSTVECRLQLLPSELLWDVGGLGSSGVLGQAAPSQLGMLWTPMVGLLSARLSPFQQFSMHLWLLWHFQKL